MKKRNLLASLFILGAVTLNSVVFSNSKKSQNVSATSIVSSIDTNYSSIAKNNVRGAQMPSDYYKTITDDLSGNELLTALRTLNLSKRTSTVGYSSMGTSASGMFKYTDYDPSTVQYDSNNQPYGTKILSFYSGSSTTSFNREHVWPNSRGGGSGGSAGSPYPDADIYMPRPTISAENSDRGNSKYVEGLTSSSAGWDPVTAFGKTLGVYEGIRGECARIIFYCMTVNSKLVLDDTATGGTTGVTMGKLSDLLKWNLENPVNDREIRRQSGGQYLQGNRNAFVDEPSYACKIWGNYNTSTQSICSQYGKSLSSLSITGNAIKTSYESGEEFSSQGLTVTATFSDKTTANVTDFVTWSPSPLTTGTTAVIASYSYQGVTKTASYSSISVTEPSTPISTTYQLEVDSPTLKYMSGTNHTQSVTLNLYKYLNGIKNSLVVTGVSEVDTSSLGTKEVSLSYGGIAYKSNVYVTNNGVTQLSQDATKTATFSSKVFSSNETKTVGDLSLTLSNNGGYYGYDSIKGQQVGSSGNPAKSMVISTPNTNSISTIKVKTSGGSSIKCTVGVMIGTTSFKCNNETTASITSNNAEYVFTGSASGDVVITWTQSSSKALYIKEISIISSNGSNYNFTGKQQAQAWAAYFINETRSSNTCLAKTDQEKLTGLKNIWTELGNEYGWMIDSSKDEFCNSTNEEIVEARNHYIYILNKFGTSQLNSFITDSKSNYLNINDSTILFAQNTNRLTIVLLISLVSLSVFGILVFTKKKK